ncbi:MAG: hypothetical protein DRP74_06000 [Candidatus Omnitrophota bacterium]|nr:MAG: hypothetical protein DRP74_06000 [Candidatus Omnitrophota bacterium]
MGRGFTLVELLIVAVIIGILATFAMPNFTVTKERTLSREAIANLRLIAAAERIYKMEHDDYLISSALDTINDELMLSINDSNWEYEIQATGGGGFSATATKGACVWEIQDGWDEPQGDSDCPKF